MIFKRKLLCIRSYLKYILNIWLIDLNISFYFYQISFFKNASTKIFLESSTEHYRTRGFPINKVIKTKRIWHLLILHLFLWLVEKQQCFPLSNLYVHLTCWSPCSLLQQINECFCLGQCPFCVPCDFILSCFSGEII